MEARPDQADETGRDKDEPSKKRLRSKKRGFSTIIHNFSALPPLERLYRVLYAVVLIGLAFICLLIAFFS